MTETSNKSEVSEQPRMHSSLQNGGDSHAKNSITARRLACKGRPERCLFLHPDTPRPREIPVLSTRSEQGLPVHLPSIRPNIGTLGLYQDPQACCSPRTRAGDVGNIYIDDILLMAESKERLRDQVAGLVYLLECLGFVVNTEKTEWEPSQSLVFLGFTVDSVTMELRLLPEKLKVIRAEARKLQGVELVSARALARLLGKMNATTQVIPPAPCSIAICRWISQPH